MSASQEADRFFEAALLAIKDRDYSRAAALSARAVELRPDFVEAWVIRGNIRMAQDDSFEANLHYEKALAVNPGLHDAWNNRGIAFSNRALWEEAEYCLIRSYEIMPSIDPCMNLANAYCTRNMLDRAEHWYRKALEHDPGDLNASINLGITLLGLRRWKEGWAYYQARHLNTPYQVRQWRLFPQWKGEPLDGKTILLWPEQGLGDEIAFMRFATNVKRAGAKHVILESMSPLMRLARTVEGVDEVNVKNETSPLGVDYACALMDVPMVMGIGPEAISCGKYLSAKPSTLSLPPGFNVGLCWQSGQRPLQPEVRATASNKSVPLAAFKPLTQMGINIISLQKENRVFKDDAVTDNEAEIRLAQQWGIVDYMGAISDLADTAELIDKLDLVISVDTAVAHLAGALGKPVWNLVRFSGYWPWLDATNHTEWYPSMRIYRQPVMFDWGEPLRQLFEDLKGLLAYREAAE